MQSKVGIRLAGALMLHFTVCIGTGPMVYESFMLGQLHGALVFGILQILKTALRFPLRWFVNCPVGRLRDVI